MSIQNEINRIVKNVADSYDAVEEKGGTIPDDINSDNLADAILSIPDGAGGNYNVISIDNGDGTQEIQITDAQGGTEIESLSVDENGTYIAPAGSAYNPVIVNVDAGTPRDADDVLFNEDTGLLEIPEGRYSEDINMYLYSFLGQFIQNIQQSYPDISLQGNVVTANVDAFTTTPLFPFSGTTHVNDDTALIIRAMSSSATLTLPTYDGSVV